MAKDKSGKKAKGKLSEDKIVRDVMKRYGETIQLKETPYVLIEILRSYGKLFQDEGDGGLPPGGTPPTGPEMQRFDTAMLMQEILKLGRDIEKLPARIAKQKQKG